MSTVRDVLEPGGGRPSEPMFLPIGVRVDAPSDLSLVGRWAWTMAAIGWRIIPLWGLTGLDSALKCDCEAVYEAPCTNKAGKHPIATAGGAPQGSHSASNDTQLVESWFRRFPNANYGVVGGFGRVIIDIDQPEQADKVAYWWREWRSYVETGRGGDARHLYALYEGDSIGNGAWGEAKGEGGYVVGPGCLHESGRTYTPHAQGQLEVLSSRLAQTLRARPGGLLAPTEPSDGEDIHITVVPTASWVDKYADGVFEGNRYNAVRDGIGHFRYVLGAEASPEGVSALLAHILKPLWKPSWVERDFRERFDKAWKYDIAHPERIEAVRKRSEAVETPDPAVIDASVTESIFVPGMMSDPGPLPMLVDHLVPRAKLVVFASQPGLGKSTARIDMGVRMALGQGSIFGYYTVAPTPLRVLVLDYENGKHIEWRRTKAVTDAIGVDISTLGERYMVSEMPPLDLSRPAGRAGFMRLLSTVRPDVCFIDSAGLAILKEEWGPEFRATVQWLKDTAAGEDVALVIVAHTVKAQRDAKSAQRQTTNMGLLDIMGNWGNFADVTMTMSPMEREKHHRVRLMVEKRVENANLILRRKNGLWVYQSAEAGPYTPLTVDFGDDEDAPTPIRKGVTMSLAERTGIEVKSAKVASAGPESPSYALIARHLMSGKGILTSRDVAGLSSPACGRALAVLISRGLVGEHKPHHLTEAGIEWADENFGNTLEMADLD